MAKPLGKGRVTKYLRAAFKLATVTEPPIRHSPPVSGLSSEHPHAQFGAGPQTSVGANVLTMRVLKLVQLGVVAALAQQLLVRAFLHQFAFAEDQNTVHIADGGKPVRNYN